MNYNKLFEDAKKNDYGCLAIIGIVLLIIALAFGISCLHAWIGMLLWNWIMPIIWEAAPVMTFWSMWGLVELCSILFKAHNYNSNNK